MLKNKKLRAVGSTVLIEIYAEEEISAGGIVTNFNTHPLDTVVGKVIELGKFAYINAEGEFNPRCRVGDIVLFKKNCGVPWQDQETKQFYRVMYDDDVIAVFEDKGE